MKIRNGFVSNSSSSSFLVFGEKPEKCNSVKLNPNQKKAVLEYVSRNTDQDVYLTEYFSDGWECDAGIITDEEYDNGGHGGPYGKEDFDQLIEDKWSGVWIRKEHNKGYYKEKNIPLNNAIAILKELLTNCDLGPHSLAVWAMEEHDLIKSTIQDLEWMEENDEN